MPIIRSRIGQAELPEIFVVLVHVTPGLKVWIFKEVNSLQMHYRTKDGSVKALLQILYGQYLILGTFGSYMF